MIVFLNHIIKKLLKKKIKKFIKKRNAKLFLMIRKGRHISKKKNQIKIIF